MHSYEQGQLNEKGQNICGAKTRSVRPCRNTALGPAGRCRNHNGFALSGAAHPGFKTGRYSKDIPARLAARYEEAAGDTELLALREDIALIDARLSDLLIRVDTGESGALWQEVRNAYKRLQQSRMIKDDRKRASGMAFALNELDETINRGHSDYQAWNEIGQVIDQRRRLVESERKRLVEMQQMITTQQAMVLLSNVVSIVKDHIDDKSALNAISADIRKLVAIEAG